MRPILLIAIALAPLLLGQTRNVQTHSTQHGRDGHDPVVSESPSPGKGVAWQDDNKINEEGLPVASGLAAFRFSNPAVAATHTLRQWHAPNGAAFKIVHVRAYCDTGSIDFNLDCRAVTAAGTPGTDVNTTELVADADSNVYTSFNGDDSCAANEVLNPSISATTGSPTECNIFVTVERL